jgi:hypothetical protein
MCEQVLRTGPLWQQSCPRCLTYSIAARKVLRTIQLTR